MKQRGTCLNACVLQNMRTSRLASSLHRPTLDQRKLITLLPHIILVYFGT
jgi:hypothetical protein